MYSKGEEVWVKVIGDDDGKISLSLKYVNQTTGEDMDPNNSALFSSDIYVKVHMFNSLNSEVNY